MSKKSKFLTLLSIIVLVYIVVTIAYLAPRSSISNLDFWFHISLGQNANWRDATSLANGIYPIGYPMLLSLAIQSGIDVLRFGQFLSWFGGGVLLASCFSLSYLITRQLYFAILGATLLLLNSHFLQFATFEGK